jgi:hypothetical protein
MLHTTYLTRATILCFSLLAGTVATQAFAQSSSSASGNDDRREMPIRHSHDRAATSGDNNIRHIERDHSIVEARTSDKNSAHTKLYRDAQTGDVSDNRRSGGDRDGDARSDSQERHSTNERGRQSDDHSERRQRDDPSHRGSR